MHHHYRDIMSRIDGAPQWFDENAVPRYDEFSPNDMADIYCDEAVLLLIKCQACGHPFKVAFSSNQYGRYRSASLRKAHAPEVPEDYLKEWSREATLAAAVLSNEIHYGDPPNACPDHCAAGATMNSIPLEVLEFWTDRTPGVWGWLRVGALERKIDCDWWEEDDGPAT